jgi:nucleotide sugar dehydrogenase
MMCDALGIDVWEVVDAAAAKPFGFMPFYPGPGLGGHCIPIDPFYLSWKAKQSGFDARFIQLAGEINGHMPEYVVSKVVDALNDQRKSLNGSRVLVLGIAYKRDIDDVRESPVLAFDYQLILDHGRGIVDTRNALGRAGARSVSRASDVIRLGAASPYQAAIAA